MISVSFDLQLDKHLLFIVLHLLNLVCSDSTIVSILEVSWMEQFYHPINEEPM